MELNNVMIYKQIPYEKVAVCLLSFGTPRVEFLVDEKSLRKEDCDN